MSSPLLVLSSANCDTGKEVEQFSKLADAYSADRNLGDVEEVSDVSIVTMIFRHSTQYSRWCLIWIIAHTINVLPFIT